MHNYDSNSERRNLIIILAVLGVGSAFALNRIVNAVGESIPWWIDAPSVAGFYGLLFVGFDNLCWRWGMFRSLKIVSTPNIRGEWTGFLRTSHDSNEIDHKAVLTIRQTWSRISIVLETDQSRSHSIVASINPDAPEGCVLSYEYFNEPTAGSTRTLHTHRGSAWLKVEDGTLQGEYFTGRDRQTYGSLEFTQES